MAALLMALACASLESPFPGVELRGSIRAADGGSPITAFRLQRTFAGFYRIGVPVPVEAPDGRFVVAGFDPADAFFLAMADGFAPKLVRLDYQAYRRAVRERTPLEVSIELDRGGEWSGRILYGGQQPVAEARFILTDEHGYPCFEWIAARRRLGCGSRFATLRESYPWDACLFRGQTGASGSWTLARVPPGIFRVAVDAPGFAIHLSEPICIHEGEVIRDFDVVLAKAGGIAGVLRSERVIAMRKPRASIVLQDARIPCQRVCDVVDGRFEFARLPPGTYSVAVVDIAEPFDLEALLRNQPQMVTVAPGGAAEVEF